MKRNDCGGSTVEDVFIGCISEAALRVVSPQIIMQAVKLWLTQQSVLKSINPEGFFAQPDTFGWSAAPEFLRYWVPLVAQKFNKFAASEYAFLHPPSHVGTGCLTSKTATLLSLDHLQNTFHQQLQDLASTGAMLPWQWTYKEAALEIFLALIFVLIYHSQPAIAVRAVEPVFLSILTHKDENFMAMPQLLSYFLPHTSFQGIPFEERVAIVADQLILRGFQFSVALTYADTVAAAAGRVEMCSTELVPMSVREVVQRVRDISSAFNTASVHIRSFIKRIDGETSEVEGLTLSKYISLVLQECRGFYLRCRQASKCRIQWGEALQELQPVDVCLVMRRLKKMLRFGSPYYEHFVRKGVWAHILCSDGWVPLQLIEEELAADTTTPVAKLPSKEKLKIVESLLCQHDNFQRFEVGYCLLRRSPFNGQRCARSLYAHEIRNPLLYRQIICQRERLVQPDDATAVSNLPLFGWVALPQHPSKALGVHPSLFPLFDNIPFIVAMPAEAIGVFRDYEERTPKAKKYDEKLHKPHLWFAEVYLRAIARDGQVMTGEADGGPASSPLSSSVMATRSTSLSSIISATSWAVEEGSHDCDTAQSATCTEVYTRVGSTSNPATQRWYVFPQYYVKWLTKAMAKSSPSHCKATDTTTTATDELSSQPATGQCDDLTVYRQDVGRYPGVLGLPKLFFTGRIAELRESTSTEIRCHAASHDGEGTAKVGAARRTVAGACGAEKAGAKSLEHNDAAPECSDAVDEGRDKNWNREKLQARQGPHRRRGTPQEFCATVEDIDCSNGVALATADSAACGEEEEMKRQTVLWKYTIATYHASSSLLPSVVVRMCCRDTAATDATTMIGLSSMEVASAYYCRCFPPSRVQSIFTDYVAEIMAEVIVGTEDDKKDAQHNGTTAAAHQQKNGRLNNKVSTLPPRNKELELLPSASYTAAASEGEFAEKVFNVASLLKTLNAFIASNELSCVVSVRVRTAAGLSLNQCRQGINKLKAFARGMGLQYVLLAKCSSRGTAASDCGRNAGGSDHEEVLDVEQYEFRKRVTWSVRELEHILHELHLQSIDIPAATLAKALTRQCEDKSFNYELLEFIGDAVMDFLVVSDACLLSNAARQRGISSDTPSAPTPLSPRTAAPQGKWEPTAWPLPLPQYCWLDAGVPLSSVMENTVNATVCRNIVIAELLPPTASRHFNDKHYPHLTFKVRADVFEAILGAAYRSGLGLDRIRVLLRRLFSFLPAAARMARAAHSESANALSQALLSCPYLLEDDALRVEQLFSYRITQLFEQAPRLLEGAVSSDNAGARETRFSTHLASSTLPRIQGKVFASMFTTGSPMYSYRRLHFLDTARLHNRILHLFSERSIGYVNEIITNITHLVLDLDKVSPHSWGLLSIIWDWYQQYYRCPAAAFALDSSGVSVVNGKWKDSCHVHFPQVTVSIDTWASLVEHIRAAVVIHLAEKEARLRNFLVAHTADYRIWLHRKALVQAVHAAGGQPRPHMWDYCDAASLLVLSCTSRAVRLSIFEHVAYVSQTLPGLASFAEVSSCADVFYGDWKENEDMVVLERHRGAPWHRLIVPLQWAKLYFAASSSSETAPVVYKPEDFWKEAIDEGLIKSKKLRLYLNDKCDIKYGTEKRPLVLDTLLVVSSHKEHLKQQRRAKRESSSPPADLIKGEGKKKEAGGAVTVPETHTRPAGAVADWLRRWPNEGAVQYHPQRHNQPLMQTTKASCTRRSRLDDTRKEVQRRIRCVQHERAVESGAVPRCASPPSSPPQRWIQPIKWDYEDPYDDPAEGWVVECAHSSTLTLSSLRTCEYRGTDQKMYTSWVDCAPVTDPVHGEQAAPPAPLFAKEGTNDILASFEDVYEHRVDLPDRLKCTSWSTWINACVLRAPHTPFKAGSKVNAWSPAWWDFDPQHSVTTLYVATEPILRLTGTDSLAAALAPPSTVCGGGGMERFAQLFIPQISYANVPPVKLSTATYGPNVFPLFPDMSVKRIEAPAERSANKAVKFPGVAEMGSTSSAPPSVPAAVACGTWSRDFFSPVPKIVALPATLQVPAAAAATLASADPTASPALGWVGRAIQYVFSATAARLEFGRLPLVVCESNSVYDRVQAEMCTSGAARPRPSLPFVLSLQDMKGVRFFVKTMCSDGNRGLQALRHIFVVVDSDINSAAVTPASVALMGRLQTLWNILRLSVVTHTNECPLLYVSSDAIREQWHRALNPLRQVL
ncbi:putative La HTH in kinetoplastid DICER domain/KptA in kinetoplastid DICER domain/Prim-pol 4 [Leishmania shawi]|uniref:La HTH in kinetoplastid DICER domain/KptA in kinetoplastid DICER domain/Prim-pol 4 n=1 Tax=Leishmania shawi TaxID=5680 RepID=A0AAW3BQJ8_9TRYP